MLRLRPFELSQPTSWEEAARAVTDAAAMPVAGGTDLLPKLKRMQFEPDTLVSLDGIEEREAIEVEGDGLRVGALVKLRDLERHPAIEPWPVLQQALGGIATPTIRNMATVGGNLCQDPRCRYYDRSELWREATGYCTKLKGDVCRVAPGSPRCHATFCSDLAPALIVLDAQVKLVGATSRWIPLAELYVDDGIRNRPRSELVAAIRVAGRPRTSRYRKLRLRDSFDFPELGVAVAVDGSSPPRVRVAMTAVASTVLHWQASCEPEDRDELVDRILAEVRPLDTLWFPPDYRKAMARRFLTRCLDEALGR